MRDQAPTVMSATTLIGDDVRNAQGEDLGKVTDMVIDLRNGRTAYVVLDFGGFLGMGNKLFAVPWEAMSVDTDQECFVLDVDRTFLEEAPGFSKDEWPSHPDFSFVNKVHHYYGLEQYHTGADV